ncbi:MAG: ATP-grasp domain-containing protein [Dehalococcoidia bacterium]|nr:ATP-grasp domain-containing protein [Dehalococcoidia bacterium]
MPTIVVLYPAYGTVSCQRVCRLAGGIEGLRLVLADDEPSSADEDLFDEVMELPPPERLSEAYGLLRRWLDKRPPDGIFVQSERALLLGSLLAREYGLKGPGVEAAHLCSNKYLQRVVTSNAGILNPRFALAETAAEALRLARAFGFPVVLKCVISTMSRLVTVVYSEEEIDAAVARMRVSLVESLDVARLAGFAATAKVGLGCDPARQFLVESFLQGNMVETDGLVVGDKPFTFGVTEQVQSVDPPLFIEGYLYPAECWDNGPIERVSDAIIAAVGLRDSAFSIELRECAGEVRLVEVNGRLGWDDGFGEMFQVRTQRERIYQAIQLALGTEPDLIRDESRCAALAYRSCYYNGIVEELPAREQLAQHERDGLRLGLSTHVGAHFVAPPNPAAYPHVAWALATHPASSREAYHVARRAVNALEVSIRRT